MWYVIQVMTGKEDDIAGKLKEQGIRACLLYTSDAADD